MVSIIFRRPTQWFWVPCQLAEKYKKLLPKKRLIPRSSACPRLLRPSPLLSRIALHLSYCNPRGNLLQSMQKLLQLCRGDLVLPCHGIPPMLLFRQELVLLESNFGVVLQSDRCKNDEASHIIPPPIQRINPKSSLFLPHAPGPSVLPSRSGTGDDRKATWCPRRPTVPVSTVSVPTSRFARPQHVKDKPSWRLV